MAEINCPGCGAKIVGPDDAAPFNPAVWCQWCGGTAPRAPLPRDVQVAQCVAAYRRAPRPLDRIAVLNDPRWSLTARLLAATEVG